MKSGSYVSSPAKEEVPKKNKKDEDSAKRFNGFVFPLEKERKRGRRGGRRSWRR